MTSFSCQVAPFLAVLIAAFIWARWSSTHGQLRFIIAVGPRNRWRTRPLMMRLPEEKDLVGAVVRVLEEGGIRSPRVILFQGQPTMDLIVDSEDTGLTLPQISDLLQSWPVRIEAVRGRRMPLRYQ